MCRKLLVVRHLSLVFLNLVFYRAFLNACSFKRTASFTKCKLTAVNVMKNSSFSDVQFHETLKYWVFDWTISLLGAAWILGAALYVKACFSPMRLLSMVWKQTGKLPSRLPCYDGDFEKRYFSRATFFLVRI